MMKSHHAGSVLAIATLMSGGAGAALSGTAQASTSRPTPLARAYAGTVAAKSARIGIHETITVGSGSAHKVTTVTGTGAADLATRQLSLDITVSGTGSLSLRVISPMVYLQLPAKDRSAIPGNKSWIGVNVTTLTKKLGGALSPLGSSAASSLNVLALLQGLSTEPVQKVGLATLHGATTTAYKATIDLSRISTVAPGAAAPLKKVMAALGTSRIPVEVWIDNQQRVRQVTDTVALPAKGRRPATTVVSTVDLYDFGAPVTVSAPPASAVLHLTAQTLVALSGGALS